VVSGCCRRALAPALYVGEWCQGAPGEVLWGRAANRVHCLPLLLLAAPAAGHLLSVCWLVIALGPSCHAPDVSPPGDQGRGRAKVPSTTAYPLAGFAVAAACGLRSMCRCGCVAVLVLYGWVHPPSLSVTRGARPCGGKEGSPDPYSGQGCCPGNEFSRAGKVVLVLEAGRSAVYAQHADCVVWRGKCETPQVCVQPSVISVCEPPGPVVQAPHAPNPASPSVPMLWHVSHLHTRCAYAITSCSSPLEEARQPPSYIRWLGAVGGASAKGRHAGLSAHHRVLAPTSAAVPCRPCHSHSRAAHHGCCHTTAGSTPSGACCGVGGALQANPG
jgi:hypothetical protein